MPDLRRIVPGRRAVALAALLLLGLSILYAVARPGAPSLAAGPAVAVGAPAPDFSAVDTDGRAVSVSGLKGRPVWLTFGGSWCPGCRAEAPDVQAAYQAYAPRNVAVVGVYLSEDSATVSAFARRTGLTFPQVPDPDRRWAAAYRVTGAPVHVFLDAAGVVRAVDYGELTPATMRARLDAIAA